MKLSARGKDWAGAKRGHVTVVRCIGKDKHHTYSWECRCDCGKVCVKSSNVLQRGVEYCSNACQLRKTNLKHGASYTREYRAWVSAKSRCFTPSHKNYPTYGARGIKMCEEWVNDFQAFFDHVGPAPTDKHTLDRIDCDGNYEPGNVRWATQQEQNNNRRDTILVDVMGETIALADMARKYGLNYGSVFARYSRGLRGNDLLENQKVGRKPKKTMS